MKNNDLQDHITFNYKIDNHNEQLNQINPIHAYIIYSRRDNNKMKSTVCNKLFKQRLLTTLSTVEPNGSIVSSVMNTKLRIVEPRLVRELNNHHKENKLSAVIVKLFDTKRISFSYSFHLKFINIDPVLNLPEDFTLEKDRNYSHRIS